MKGNRIDELFRNGLEAHKTPAPIGTWNKIEAGLPQKKKKGAIFWISIAASFTLIAASGWLILNNQNQSVDTPKEILSNKPQEIDSNTFSETETTKEDTQPEAEVEVEVIEPSIEKLKEAPTLLASTQNIATDISETLTKEITTFSEESLSLRLELIQPQLLKPQFIVRATANRSVQLNTDQLMQDLVLSPEEFRALEGEQKKKFGFLGGIVSMAKSVNNGAKAISEIRKSKNKWISNDLKYGDKTDASAEDSKDDAQDLNQE